MCFGEALLTSEIPPDNSKAAKAAAGQRGISGHDGPDKHSVGALRRADTQTIHDKWRPSRNGALGNMSDVLETEDNIEISIAQPGMETKELDANVSNNVPMIKGEKKVEREEEK